MPRTQISVSSLEEVTLRYINDGKYKTNYTNIFFSMPLTAENATMSSLSARILKRGSERYPTMAELNSALDMNYSTTIAFSSFKEGEKIVFLMSVATLKNEYAPNGEDIFGRALDIAFDTLLSPLTENGAFVEEYFESEKINLRDSILSQINNKSGYSRSQFIKAMCEGEAYSVNGEGDVLVLDEITNEKLYAFYKNMIKTAVC